MALITYTTKLHVVRIEVYLDNGWNTHYFRKDMQTPFMHKWRWYFKYRAALLQVKNPKRLVRMRIDSYDYVPPKDILEKRLKNILKGAKAQLTKTLKKLEKAKHTASEQSLFPEQLIENSPLYPKVLKKIELQKYKVKKAEECLDKFYAGTLELPENINPVYLHSSDLLKII